MLPLPPEKISLGKAPISSCSQGHKRCTWVSLENDVQHCANVYFCTLDYEAISKVRYLELDKCSFIKVLIQGGMGKVIYSLYVFIRVFVDVLI